MWASDITDCGYEIGTFKLGDKVYHVRNKEHRFRFHKKCRCCDSTGYVFIKGMEYICPSCKGCTDYVVVIEKVIDDRIDKIESVISFKNKNKELEIYTNDSSGYGVIIKKQDDGSNTYFKSKEEAQCVCDEYNDKNNVYNVLREYKMQEAQERF